jgi:uncharacterized membrane protein
MVQGDIGSAERGGAGMGDHHPLSRLLRNELAAGLLILIPIVETTLSVEDGVSLILSVGASRPEVVRERAPQPE